MPRYRIEFRPSAEKDLKRLDSTTRQRVIDAIWKLAGNPRPSGCRKLINSRNAYRIRVGDYRIIYTISDVILVVGIESIRHRREAYR
ncbi:MAG: type II toxin-antitoxin system RelE/ParE family toxin [Verrucomicrobiota bacterium]|nr:type II toxin-antitoxin system RelE/ParE family toxin [Verrucomicrobiota bacterium]